MRRTLVAVVFVSLLGNPSLPSQLWTFLESLWPPSLSTKEGGGCDPNGRCLPDPQPPSQPKAGGGWDPFGRPLPPDPSDAGGGCDPNGRCNSGS